MNDAYTKQKIDVGDIVAVTFNNSQLTLSRHATVLFMPSGPGDCWGLRDDETGFVHYVSEGCTISKRMDSSTPDPTTANEKGQP